MTLPAPPAAPDLLVVGNLLVDDLVFDDGRTRMAEPGGAVLYAALGAALWGVRVGVVSLRGDDYPAWALDGLAARGVELAGVRPLGGPGARAWLLYEGPRRQLIHRLDRPSHAQVSPRPGDWPAEWRRAGRVHLTPMPLEVQTGLVAALRGEGVGQVSLDPHVPLRDDTLAGWSELLPRLDVLFVGPDELRFDRRTDLRARLQTLATGRLRLVACKLGAQGGVLLDVPRAEALEWQPAAAPVVDPTGAGDAFAGGFLAGLALGDPLAAAARRGAVSASFALADWGPRGLLAVSREAAEERLSAERARVAST